MTRTAAHVVTAQRWHDDVAALLEAAPDLIPAARGVDAAVLCALIEDPLTDPVAVADSSLLLRPVSRAEGHCRRDPERWNPRFDVITVAS